MKANKKSRISDLSTDILEYMFVEWLVRQGVFSAYKANCEKFHPHHRSFFDNLRTKIRCLSRPLGYSIGNLISTSFPFAMTPEGYDFWVDQSIRWNRFCDKLKSIL